MYCFFWWTIQIYLETVQNYVHGLTYLWDDYVFQFYERFLLFNRCCKILLEFPLKIMVEILLHTKYFSAHQIFCYINVFYCSMAEVTNTKRIFYSYKSFPSTLMLEY